jgi:hypothetical protein
MRGPLRTPRAAIEQQSSRAHEPAERLFHAKAGSDASAFSELCGRGIGASDGLAHERAGRGCIACGDLGPGLVEAVRGCLAGLLLTHTFGICSVTKEKTVPLCGRLH